MLDGRALIYNTLHKALTLKSWAFCRAEVSTAAPSSRNKQSCLEASRVHALLHVTCPIPEAQKKPAGQAQYDSFPTMVAA